jgi:hypothetical protein
MFVTPFLHRIKIPELRTFANSRLHRFQASENRELPAPWKTCFENFVKLNVSRVTGFPEFPNIVPCRHGTTNFLLGLSTVRGTAARLRALPAQARPSWCDYFWPHENTILLWYEWWLTQFHTCKVDFVIYFYVISYIRLYNAYNTCYQEGITYRFANWPFSCRAGPSTTQNTCRAVPLIVPRS